MARKSSASTWRRRVRRSSQISRRRSTASPSKSWSRAPSRPSEEAPSMTSPEDAKAICECQLLGLEREGMETSSNPNVVGVGIGRKIVRGIATSDIALKVYVKQKIHPLLVRDEQVIPDEVEGVPTDVEEAGEFSIWRPIPPIYQRKVRPAMGEGGGPRRESHEERAHDPEDGGDRHGRERDLASGLPDRIVRLHGPDDHQGRARGLQRRRGQRQYDRRL